MGHASRIFMIVSSLFVITAPEVHAAPIGSPHGVVPQSRFDIIIQESFSGAIWDEQTNEVYFARQVRIRLHPQIIRAETRRLDRTLQPEFSSIVTGLKVKPGRSTVVENEPSLRRMGEIVQRERQYESALRQPLIDGVFFYRLNTNTGRLDTLCMWPSPHHNRFHRVKFARKAGGAPILGAVLVERNQWAMLSLEHRGMRGHECAVSGNDLAGPDTLGNREHIIRVMAPMTIAGMSRAEAEAAGAWNHVATRYIAANGTRLLELPEEIRPRRENDPSGRVGFYLSQSLMLPYDDMTLSYHRRQGNLLPKNEMAGSIALPVRYLPREALYFPDERALMSSLR